MRRATHLGEAVESRGFSPDIVGNQRTYLKSLKMQPRDILLIAAGTAILVVVITLKAMYFCYANGIFYAFWLRGYVHVCTGNIVDYGS